MPAYNRDYAAFRAALRPAVEANTDAKLQTFVDRAWEHFAEQGVSWVGFYLPDRDSEMVLGPRRDKPACSPIGLHGACGRAFQSLRPLVVRDVKHLGENYVACDPRDQSELVLPLIDATGAAWAVLDLDSFDVDAFTIEDAEGFAAALHDLELTHARFNPESVEVV